MCYHPHRDSKNQITFFGNFIDKNTKQDSQRVMTRMLYLLVN